MNNKEFDKLLNERVKKIRKTLSNKSAEYSRDSDKLYNFKRAAEIERCSPAKALLGMMIKHTVSVIDIIEKCEQGIKTSNKLIDEKIGDNINYLILLEAILKEYDEYKELRRWLKEHPKTIINITT